MRCGAPDIYIIVESWKSFDGREAVSFGTSWGQTFGQLRIFSAQFDGGRLEHPLVSIVTGTRIKPMVSITSET